MLCVVSWILADVCAAAWIVCRGDKGRDDFVGPVLDRVAKMGAAEQQAWLARLEQRAARGPTDAEARRGRETQARIAALLHQKLVTWRCCGRRSRRPTAARREAIELLARRYRSRVLDAFHKQLSVTTNGKRPGRRCTAIGRPPADSSRSRIG